MDNLEPERKLSSQGGSQSKANAARLSHLDTQLNGSPKYLHKASFKQITTYKDGNNSIKHILNHSPTTDTVSQVGGAAASKASEDTVTLEKDDKCPPEDQISKLVEQGKSVIGPVGLQAAVLKHLIQANAFPAAASTDFTKQPHYISNLVRLKASKAMVTFLLSRRKRRIKQSVYQASKDYKRFYDEWQGRSTRSYGRRKSRNRSQDEALHYKYSGGDVVRSEKEYLETLQSLACADNVSQGIANMCTSADIPAMDPSAPRPMNNSNGLVLDPTEHFFRNASADHWSEQEKALFVEAYLQHPKQFGRIAQALPKKTPSQCVLFYYRSKKLIDLKVRLDRKRKAQVQKSRRRSNTFGRKPRGREKNKQSIPSPDHRATKSRKDDQAAPSPAASSSSHEHLDVVGDKEVSKSDFQADESLVEPEAQELLEDLPPLVASPVLSPCVTPREAIDEEPKKTPASSNSITKINNLLNSPTDAPEPKWNQSAILEWFGENNDMAPPEKPMIQANVLPIEPPVSHHEPHYRSQELPPHQANYSSSYHHNDKQSWTSTQESSFFSMPPVAFPRINSSMASQSSRLYHNLSYHAPRQQYYFQRPQTYSYRDQGQTLPPRLHQPILILRAPTEPPTPHSSNGPSSYPQNPNSDPAPPLGTRYNPRHI